MKRTVATLTILMTLIWVQGCAYVANRTSDAQEVIDVGLTFSAKPQFSAFVIFPPIHLTPVGYGEVDGRFIGLGGGQFHLWSPYYEHSVGALLWGRETLSFDQSKMDLEGLSSSELAAEATHYNTGLIGLMEGPPRPTENYAVSCPHYLHLGWIGIVFTPRYNEMLDFILGFTTLDISGDDIHGRGKK